jgi:hypothetical protein
MVPVHHLVRVLPRVQARLALAPSSPNGRILWALYTAKASVTHPGINHLRSPGGGPVTETVAVRAQERAALDHFARDLKLRLTGVVAVGRAAWPLGATRPVPVGGPLPDIASDVE